MQVFVYGTLKRGYGNYHVMEKAQGDFIGLATVKDYAAVNALSYPYAFKKEGAIIRGEVFKVSINKIWILDQLEGYPYHYNRALVDTPYGEAWIYYARGDITHLVDRYGLTEEWK